MSTFRLTQISDTHLARHVRAAGQIDIDLDQVLEKIATI